MDHAAGTYLDERVREAMEPFWIEKFGNPSALYKEGREARQALENARESVAGVIGARGEEIIFTNGGTESNNLAIFGVAYNIIGAGKNHMSVKSPHIITAKFEHKSVLRHYEMLKKNGFSVTYLDVGKDGIVKAKDVKNALRPETVLVSIMYANNEIGTIQPIAEIGKIINNYKPQNNHQKIIFHCDACQAAGYLDLNVNKLGVDLMIINGSKIYGPKGISFLYVRRGVKLCSTYYSKPGDKLHSGTENVPAIVGLAEALEIAQTEKDKESARLTELRDYFIKRIMDEIPKVFLNGHPEKRLPNNVNVSILGVEGEAVILYLDEYGIACSTGSACTSESFDPSHVILALGKPRAHAHGSVRFTLGKRNTKEEVDFVVETLKGVVEKLRSISAVNV